jgi:hypothetical protein
MVMAGSSKWLWIALILTVAVSLILTFPQILLVAAVSFFWPLDFRGHPWLWLLCMGIFCIVYVGLLSVVNRRRPQSPIYRYAVSFAATYILVGAFWTSTNLLTRRPFEEGHGKEFSTLGGRASEMAGQK